MLAALEPGYTPLPGLGVWHLRIGTEFRLASGTIGSAATAPFSLPIPQIAALTGLDLFFQGGVVDAGGIELTDVLVSRVR